MQRLPILILLLLWPVAAQAQRTPTYEALTVGSSATGISAATLADMAICTAVLETAEVRWRNDGTAPTSTVGTPIAVGTAIAFDNITDARSAQFIRTSSTSGVLHVNCFPTAGAIDLGSGRDSLEIAGDALTALQAIEAATEDIASNLATDAVIGNSQTLYTGGPRITGHASTTAPTAVTAGQMQGAWYNLNGAAAVFPVAHSIGGSSNLKRTSVGLTEDEHTVCSGPCTLYSVMITNTNAAARYFRCADIASTGATTPGTSTPVIDVAIPGNTAGAGFSLPLPVAGTAFATGLTCWFVTGAADTDVAEVAANEIKAFYTFKQ